MLATPEYVDQMQSMHRQRADFGKRGNQWAGMVFANCAELRSTDVLDYGCGKGVLNLCLPFAVHCYDPAIPKYAATPEPADIVFCGDVLEHIEPDCLEDVLADLQRVTKKVGLFFIHCGPARKKLPDGRNAHLIQKPPSWWAEKLAEYFDVQESQEVPMMNPDTKQVVPGLLTGFF